MTSMKLFFYRFFLVFSILLMSYVLLSNMKSSANLNLTKRIFDGDLKIFGVVSTIPTTTVTTTSTETTSTTATTTSTTSTTSTTTALDQNQTNDSLPQPKEAFVTFSNNNPNYLALFKIFLDSVHAFSTRPVIAFGIDVDLDVDTKEYPRLIKRRISQKDCGPVRLFDFVSIL